MARVYTDCRETPNIKGCTLRIEGEPDEVMKAAVQHMVAVHEEIDTPEFRDMIRKSLKPAIEQPFGTTARPEMTKEVR